MPVMAQKISWTNPERFSEHSFYLSSERPEQHLVPVTVLPSIFKVLLCSLKKNCFKFLSIMNYVGAYVSKCINERVGAYTAKEVFDWS